MSHLTAARICELVEADDGTLERALKAELLPDAVRALKAGLGAKCEHCGKGAQRWAVLAVLQVCKLIGAQPQVLIALFQAVGVKGQDELLDLVASGRKFRELGADRTDEEYFEAATDMLAALVRKHPEWGARAAQRIGVASYAVEEPHTNGDTNGHAQG